MGTSNFVVFLWGGVHRIEPLLLSSETAVLGWLLLAIGVGQWEKSERFSFYVQRIALALLIFIYTYSGLSKSLDAGWMSGYTLDQVFQSELIRFDFLRGVGSVTFYQVLGIVLIFIQLGSAIFFLGKQSRRGWWWAHTLFHLLSILVLRVEQVNFVFLIYHFYIWNALESKPAFSEVSGKI